MTKLTFATPLVYTTVPAQTVTLSSLTVTREVDNPEEQTVKVFTKELPNPIVLWSGAAYTAIGQWTDTDVQTALKALFPTAIVAS